MSDVSEAAAVLGKLGGRKGGKSRSAAKVAAARVNVKKATVSMSPEQRKERARKAAKKRWEGKTK